MSADPDRAWEARLRTLHVFIEEDHFSVKLRACAACGQPFATVFGETVDWVGGEDPQFGERLPLTAAEADALASLPTAAALPRIEALAGERRRLRMSFPSSAERQACWTRDPLTIAPPMP